MAIGYIAAQLDHLPDVEVRIHTVIITLVVRVVGQTRLVQIVERQEVAARLRTAVHAQRMLGDIGWLIDFAQPVVIDMMVGVGTILGRKNIIFRIFQGRTGIEQGFIYHLHILAGTDALRLHGAVLESDGTVIRYRQLPFLPSLRGYEDYTVGGTRTIDRSRGRILQHRDILNLRCRHLTQRHLDTVHQNQRLRIPRRTDTTQVDFRVIATRRTSTVHHRNTRA